MARPKKVENTTEYKVPAETVSDNGNGHDNNSAELSYEEFLDSLKEKGAIADGNSVSGQMLLGQTAERRAAAVHYISSVGEAESVYPKDKMRARILDQMARTIFPSQQHHLAFIGLMNWATEFGELTEVYEYCLEYVVGAPSINGRSREELVASVTTVNNTFRNYSADGKNNKPKRNSQPNIS